MLDELEHEVYDDQNDDYYQLGSKVKSLDVSKNRLVSLDPQWFEALRGLTALDVSRNALRDLPPNVASLRLASLNLSGNPLGGFDFAFPSLDVDTPLAENLAHLNLSNCRGEERNDEG